MICRPTTDEYFIIMAMHASSRGSCVRRRVGCVLVDSNNYVLSTGYNGPVKGEVNCTTTPCAGAGLPSGTGLDMCRAIHGEASAIMQCPDSYKIETAYITTSPCISCMKLLLNTPCKRIVYLTKYAKSHDSALDSWIESNRSVDWIFDLIDDNSPVHMFSNIYGF